EYQFETLPGAINQQAEATYQNALEGAQAATDAVAASQAAIAAAGAQLWESGKTYAQGEAAISRIDMQTYRRRTAGSGTVDPAEDPANWAQVGAVTSDDIWAATLAI